MEPDRVRKLDTRKRDGRIMSVENTLPELRRLVKRIAKKVGLEMEKISKGK